MISPHPGSSSRKALEGVPEGTTRRFLVCLASASRWMTESKEAQHEDHHPLPVLPKELGDASIFLATGVMEAVLTPLLLAGNGGSPFATDIAHLQRAQQHHLRDMLRAPKACSLPLSRLWGSSHCWVTSCRSSLWTAVSACAGAAMKLLRLVFPGAH